MTMDAEQIVAGLDARLKGILTILPDDQFEIGPAHRYAHELITVFPRTGLTRKLGRIGSHPHDCYTITPLGLQVRAILQAANQ